MNDIKKIIKKYAIDKNIKWSDCANSIGISKANFYGFFKGNRVVDVDIIRKIAKFSGVSENIAIEEYKYNLKEYLKDKGL